MNDLSTLLPYVPPMSDLQKNLAFRWLIRGTSLPSSLSSGSAVGPFIAQPLSLGFIGPSGSKQRELGLSNTTREAQLGGS